MALKPKKWDLEVDFVAVGSGGGAITAAIVAHDMGKQTVVLEKAPKLGGVTAYSGGQVFLPNNHVMKRAGVPDSFEDGRKYLDFLAAGKPISIALAGVEFFAGTIPEAAQEN